MSDFSVYIAIVMYLFAHFGFPFSTNIGLSVASVSVYANLIMLVVLILFGVSFNSKVGNCGSR